MGYNKGNSNDDSQMEHNEKACKEASSERSVVEMRGDTGHIDRLSREQAYKAPATLGNVPSGK